MWKCDPARPTGWATRVAECAVYFEQLIATHSFSSANRELKLIRRRLQTLQRRFPHHATAVSQWSLQIFDRQVLRRRRNIAAAAPQAIRARLSGSGTGMLEAVP